MPDAPSTQHYEVIVIGSGFGGSVVACRLAQKGRRVLVLERGDKYPPGSFPRTPLGASTNVWDPSQRLYGLFDIWSFKKFESLVSSGLGGGSLIYANVLLRKPRAWFVDEGSGREAESWPLRYEDLERHYVAAELMLGAKPYPYGETSKTKMFREAAEKAQLAWAPAPLAVSFSEDGEPLGQPIGVPADNLHRALRTTCRLCGECNVGCNTGSKNTTDMTYLSVADRHDADILHLHEVRRITPIPDRQGYEVRVVKHTPPDPRHNRAPGEPEREYVTFTANCVVLAAGSLGSTYLLLRNRLRLPELSHRLGTKFSANGDYLGLIQTKDGRAFDASRAPVITSYVTGGEGAEHAAISARDSTGRGYLLQDGGYPLLVDWLVETAGIRPIGRVALAAWQLLRARFSDSSRTQISANLTAIVGESKRSRGIMPMLGMGRDLPGGVMSLKGGDLVVDWDNKTFSEPVFDPIQTSIRRIAAALGGKFMWTYSNFLSRTITVHPLGGVPMGRNVENGVVDSFGEVFNYPGLFVADGSVLPGPAGVNPALTIAALAERFSERVIERTEWAVQQREASK